MFPFLKTKKIFQVQKHIGTFQRQNPDRNGAQEQLEKRFEKILTIEYDTGQRSFWGSKSKYLEGADRILEDYFYTKM